ncbi:hypothetical protein FB45DRAFT_213354 [Roridomyces roridus]|uniref:Uncharacterized protein n=1 Tax=Roridomyces roridus TaxID=1738132 RepID=A0AAD7CGL6_9AGAR|nr:hypothetical protein FB45DRAFT_213354 [Roridomyces roridus]
MVTTRKQAEKGEAAEAPDNLSKRPAPDDSALKPTSPAPPGGTEDVEPPTKKVKIETPEEESARRDEYVRQTGTTERGHIYFFFRPRVQTDNPSSIDDVKNLHMLLVPRPPKSGQDDGVQAPVEASEDMKLVEQGADAVPASALLDDVEQHYRLIAIGKKTLPDPDARRGRRKESFWATVIGVGDDLHSLEKGMGEKTYETKTRGTRYDPPARLAARGCYALVNAEAPTPSQETTYLGYALSHPTASDFGAVQTALGLQRAAAFILQVKNPQAEASDVGPSTNKHVTYPPEIMDGVFGRGTRGREPAGLRFAPCAVPELLDHTGTELLLIAVRGSEEGLEESLGEGRGEAMTEASEADQDLTVGEIFRELWGEDGEIPEALSGEWI